MLLMMRSSLLGSWIDVEAAAAAAETLCHALPAETGPAADQEVRPDEAGGGEAEEEAVNEMPPARLHGKLSELRARAQRNGLLPVGAGATGPEFSPFLVPLGSLPVRVRALADWLHESFGPEALFVVDDRGQPLVEFRGGADLLAAATVLAEAAVKARRHLPGGVEGALVHLTLGAGQVLSLVSVKTVLGPWQVGLTTAFPVSEGAALVMVRHVQAAAAGV